VLPAVKGVLYMKVKVTEFNGALTVSVFGLGLRQELVISGELCGFAFELRDREEPIQTQLFSQDEMDEITTAFESEVDKAGDMFRKLAELRKEIAVADGVPPYVVFHDKTLHEMVDKLPDDLQSLGKISGVGRAKLDKYGERFLAIINGAVAKLQPLKRVKHNHNKAEQQRSGSGKRPAFVVK
jgi:ATP-dependent DNA helicase RecQ